jgi:hypothetical protein
VEQREPWGRLYLALARAMGLVYGVVLGKLVRSTVGSGLLYWCNSRAVLQIGAMSFVLVVVGLILYQLL